MPVHNIDSVLKQVTQGLFYIGIILSLTAILAFYT